MNTKHENAGFLLDEKAGYFKDRGVSCMVFDDFYPEGHQSGVTLIMHGKRILSNGDVRFEQCPGQWQPVPKKTDRVVDTENNSITASMHFPDIDRHLRGFNPMIYPDCELDYNVTVTGDEKGLTVRVDFNTPAPAEFEGKLSFNVELFPGYFFGKSWIIDGKTGVFPRQANGPSISLPSNYEHTGHLPEIPGGANRERLSGGHVEYNPIIADDIIAAPYGEGYRFTACPEESLSSFTIVSETAPLKIYDGRLNHNNGWFVLSSEIPAGKTKDAVVWRILPKVSESWVYPPVIQIPQTGFHPAQEKFACIERDPRDTSENTLFLMRLTEDGEECVKSLTTAKWGNFLRYSYDRADFTDVKEEGLYFLRYGDVVSSVFRIAEDIYDRGVWQPVLEYFLPVQMCHMRVNEKYRVWHGRCHMDDARMAPKSYTLFDGYKQDEDIPEGYKPGGVVPGLNKGGWHDAGDFDLRVESQAGECYKLTLAYEEFGVYYDETTIDQERQITEIHQPDGKNDILQQIEHGLLTVLGSYRAFGKLYRGIICGNLRQYVLLGDAAAMTDGIPGNEDDRLVFTDDMPFRSLISAAYLAASSRAMRGFNDSIGEEALAAAEAVYRDTPAEGRAAFLKIQAASELYLTTGKKEYLDDILAGREIIFENMAFTAWSVCRVIDRIDDQEFLGEFKKSLVTYAESIREMMNETPYGIPYRPKSG
ncbi:MAG: glycoside hydrolase family 9 protein, partial [Lachnospiraceae bacterium]|nr:glycoside hydrolase family 9 protein [Lachnospiraceae bacterium]